MTATKQRMLFVFDCVADTQEARMAKFTKHTAAIISTIEGAKALGRKAINSLSDADAHKRCTEGYEVVTVAHGFDRNDTEQSLAMLMLAAANGYGQYEITMIGF